MSWYNTEKEFLLLGESTSVHMANQLQQTYGNAKLKLIEIQLGSVIACLLILDDTLWQTLSMPQKIML